MDTDVSIPANWSAPRELARALPREIHLSGGGAFLAGFALLLGLSSIPLYLFTQNLVITQTARAKALREQGTDATGEVVRLWHSSDKEQTPMVEYAFTAGTIRLFGQSNVPDSAWKALQKAGMIPIRYLPSDPRTNHPAGWEADIVPKWVPMVMPALLVLLAGMLRGVLWTQASLLTWGLTAPAAITKCGRTKGGWTVKYRFRTKEGAFIDGRGTVSRKVEVGATVCVLYRAEKPARNKVYPFDFYRTP